MTEWTEYLYLFLTLDILVLSIAIVCCDSLLQAILPYNCYHRIRHCRRGSGRDIDSPITISISNSGQHIGDPEKRRKLILSSIIIKNAVLPDSKGSRESQSHNDVEEGTVVDHVDLKVSNSSSDNNKKNFNEDGIENEQKGNLLLDTIRSITSSVSESIRVINGDNDDNTSGDKYLAKSCPICLEGYTAGQEICWSRNDKYIHSFHFRCMQAWLMKSDDCPPCRENYLNTGLDTG